MKLNVMMLCGPRHCGKSTLIRLLCNEAPQPPHYVRLVPIENRPRRTVLGDLRHAGLASWHRVNYEADRAFERVPEAVERLGLGAGQHTIFMEADTDSNLRYAYPYDHRVFIMPAPHAVEDLFRSPAEAAKALKEVMDDTAAFASEIFGLFEPGMDDSATFTVNDRGGQREERVEITAAQMRRFIVSPLGAEIASRIQLQPVYHGLIESDVILINMGLGGTTSIVDDCIDRLQVLISRLSDHPGRGPALFACDLMDAKDPLQHRVVKNLAARLL